MGKSPLADYSACHKAGWWECSYAQCPLGVGGTTAADCDFAAPATYASETVPPLAKSQTAAADVLYRAPHLLTKTYCRGGGGISCRQDADIAAAVERWKKYKQWKQ